MVLRSFCYQLISLRRIHITNATNDKQDDTPKEKKVELNTKSK